MAKKIWVLGSGTFGVRAVRQLSGIHGAGSITLVDPSPRALDQAAVRGITKVCEEGVAFLHKNLSKGERPDWIVPALPVHLAWEWGLLALGQNRLVRSPLPEILVSSLPNAITGDSGDIYVSHADFICPTNCSEPDQFCTRTGEPRKKDMYRLLAQTGQKGMPFFVIRSLQLGPGVGGYQPKALFDLLDRITSCRGLHAVVTACRCHGVVTGGKRIKAPV
ncbi:MAG: potassium transporter [Desulfobacterales bacterium]|nr:potassium transporter [Desulfobacterales bacterium]